MCTKEKYFDYFSSLELIFFLCRILSRSPAPTHKSFSVWMPLVWRAAAVLWLPVLRPRNAAAAVILTGAGFFFVDDVASLGNNLFYGYR